MGQMNTSDKQIGSNALWSKDFIQITCCNLLLFLSFQMLMPTLPIHVKDLGGTDSMIGWIIGVATIASLIVRPFSGLALDKIGRRSVLIAGLIVIILMTISYAWFSTIALILILRFIHGFGWGATTTASSTIASDCIPKLRFGEGMGYFGLSTSLAMALAPGIGLFVLAKTDFMMVTWLSAFLACLAAVLGMTIRSSAIPRTSKAKSKHTFYERSSIRPAIIMFFVSMSFGAISGFISLYGYEKGIENIGVFFTVYATSVLVTRPFIGRLIDSRGFDIAIIPGLALAGLALLLLSQVETLAMFLLSGLIYGVGIAAVHSSLQTMAVIKAPRERFGSANATFFTGFDSGIGLGSVVAGMIASAVGYGQMFIWFAAAIGIALVLYLLFAREKASDRQVQVNE